MAADLKSRLRPLDGAVQRIVTLAGRSAPPSRMAREVELIVSEWERELGGEIEPIQERVHELHEALVSGVADAEEQASDVDRSDVAAARQADATLVALMTCRDAAARWLRA
jgi:archaellum component FlaC